MPYIEGLRGLCVKVEGELHAIESQQRYQNVWGLYSGNMHDHH